MARRWLILLSVLAFTAFGVEAQANTDDGLDIPTVWHLRAVASQHNQTLEPRSLDQKTLEDIFLDDSELGLYVDYESHPEVDRWTKRNNRIRLRTWFGAWFYSGELDVRHHYANGLSLSWEVPGFIAIHFEAAISPLARLEVKPGGSANQASSRHADGNVSNAYLSLAIFNPELSNENLAFWAGVGAGVWYFDFQEGSVQGGGGLRADVDFQELSPAGKVFIEIDYKISDTLHVGFGFATHIIYSEHTDDGRFYEVNNVQGGVASGGALTQDGRNDGLIGHLSVVWDIHLSISIVF
jgi:hypothetical protein